MRINTRHFGLLDVEENGIIDFSEGIPGFPDAKKFVLLGSGDGDSPFKWLQSVDRPELAFAVVDPFMIKKDYEINLDDDVLSMLDIEEPGDVLVYSIVVVPEDILKISMNLKAPVVINARKKKGAQVVLDTAMYGVRHYIMDELREREVLEDACADKKKRPVYCNRR